MGFKTMAYFKVSLNRDTKASGVAGGVRPPDENTRDRRVFGGKDTLPLSACSRPPALHAMAPHVSEQPRTGHHCWALQPQRM